jgi:16S rRNA (adenine1518-N6/adenine1519-N6)-dimethyltransferase
VTDAGLGAGRVRALLEAHGVRPSKSLGQNFVIDPNTIRKLVAHARLEPTETVLEVGAGVGSLTVALARVASRVVAVELDRGLVSALVESLDGASNVDVVHGDALRLDLDAFGARSMVANLPYNIAAAVVIRALESAPRISALTVMTQREVGERLVAAPGSRLYGRASVIVSFHARARIAMTVSRRAFYPVPRVDSVVVRMERRARQRLVDPERLAIVVRAAFSQRRKTLRNALAPLAGSVTAAEAALREARLDPAARAETVSVDGFVALARVLPA